jgi:S-adenosylmethionine synthetase
MLITSESLKVGHPDIECDSIAANIIATIVDEEHKIGVTVDTMPHCGVEIFLGKGLCIVVGEVANRAYVDVAKIVRDTVLLVRQLFPTLKPIC